MLGNERMPGNMAMLAQAPPPGGLRIWDDAVAAARR